MKFAARLVLVMFVLFISTPTIVSVIKKSVDTSYFYSMSEEEHAHKEIKADFHEHTYHFVDLSGQTSSLILSENLSRHDNVSATIFIPPPERA